MNIPIIGDIFKTIGDGVKAWNDGRVRIKEAKINAKVAQWNAKARLAEKEADAEKDWDLQAMKNAQNSWKDEVITIIWFTPFILLFIPQTQSYVIKGFKALAEVPYGYWLVLFGIVASAFGLRWLFQKRVEKAISSIKGFKNE